MDDDQSNDAVGQNPFDDDDDATADDSMNPFLEEDGGLCNFLFLFCFFVFTMLMYFKDLFITSVVDIFLYFVYILYF